jgi:hypothetical protein
VFNVAALAPVLQSLFTTRADELAQSTGFIRRRRGFTGSEFLEALVLGWHRRPDATLEDLALPLGVSRQALQQRWSAPRADFCSRALLDALGHAFAARPEVFPLLERFAGAFIDDSTQLWLPDACAGEFPGNNRGGGLPGKARMKALAREVCRWTVLFTNVPSGWLTAEQVWLVYRLRWQVEQLSKRLKSEGGMRRNRSEDPRRVECEWHLKLLGQLARNWPQLLRGGPMLDVNPRQMGRVIADWLKVLSRALPALAELVRALSELRQELMRLRRRTRRRSRKTAHQLLREQIAPAA